MRHYTIHDIAVSLMLETLLSHSPTKTWKCPTYLTRNEAFLHTLHSAWSEYKLFNNVHDIDPVLFSEVGKAYLREKIIAYTSSFKKANHNFANCVEQQEQMQRSYLDVRQQTW